MSAYGPIKSRSSLWSSVASVLLYVVSEWFTLVQPWLGEVLGS